MSAKGAEGILRAAGKLPPEPKPILSPPEPKATKARGSAPPDTESPSTTRAKEGQGDDGGAAKGKAAGEKIGKFVGGGVGSGISMTNEAAGFALGLLAWGWLVRPYLQKGVPGVKAVLLAKFFNKKPDGSYLP